MEIDDNGEVVEIENDKLDGNIDETENIKRPRPYLDRYKNFAPSLNIGIMYDDVNHNKTAKLLRYKSSRTEGLNDCVPLSEYVERMKECQDEI